MGGGEIVDKEWLEEEIVRRMKELKRWKEWCEEEEKRKVKGVEMLRELLKGGV